MYCEPDITDILPRRLTMGEERICSCAEKHHNHLCVLRSKGLTKEISHLTSNPNVTCVLCGEDANSEESVCSPVPLFI